MVCAKLVKGENTVRVRGGALIYVTVVMPVLLLFVGLCMDQALIVIGQQQLQIVADASALAGAAELTHTRPHIAARTAAREIAAMNQVLGANALVQNHDIDLGMWDHRARVFSPLRDNEHMGHANAVRVKAVASAERNNGIRTLLGPLMGLPQSDAEQSAVAYMLHADPPRGFTGLESFDSRGVLTTAAVEPNGHPRLLEMLRNPRMGGDIVSNGNVRLHLLGLAGVTWIRGDVKSGGRVERPLINLTRIDGEVSQLAEPIHCPAVPDNLALVNDNDRIRRYSANGKDFVAVGTVDVPAGTYRVRDLTILAGAIVRVQGPVKLIVTGKLTVLGSVLNLNQRPRDLRVLVSGAQTIDLAATADLYADLYAPESDLRITAGLRYTGRFVAEDVDILGTSFLYADPTLGDPFDGLKPLALVD